MPITWTDMSIMEPTWYASDPRGLEIYMNWDETEWIVLKEGWTDPLNCKEFEIGRAPTIDGAKQLAEQHVNANQ